MLERNPESSKLRKTLVFTGYTQIVKTATRETNNSKSLIDLIITNRPDRNQSKVWMTGISDHDIILAVRKIPEITRIPCEVVRVRRFSKIDWSAVKTEIYAAPWWILPLSPNPDQQFEMFYKTIDYVLNIFAPFKSIRVQKKRPSWMSSKESFKN